MLPPNVQLLAGASDGVDGSSGDGKPPDVDLKLDTLAGVLTGDIRVHVHCYRADDIAQMFDMAHEFGFTIAAAIFFLSCSSWS